MSRKPTRRESKLLKQIKIQQSALDNVNARLIDTEAKAEAFDALMEPLIDGILDRVRDEVDQIARSAADEAIDDLQITR